MMTRGGTCNISRCERLNVPMTLPSDLIGTQKKVFTPSNFKIGAVPTGRYTVEIFHPASGKQTNEVLVAKSKIVKVNFSVNPK